MQSYDTTYRISHSDLAYGRKLGEGGFGEVFRGTWHHSDVAIKRLKMQTLSPEASQELETEAKMMAELRHDNIIGFRGFCYESPHYALVMEYMPRGSLYALLHSAQEIDWQARLQISIGAGAGLVYLHNKNILHRDIKSLNVLLHEKEGVLHAKLTDFGLSKVKIDTKLTTSTAKNASGTLAWMAPELFARRAKYEKASDIYSFAVMLWEIASRRVPFEDAHDPGLIPGWVKDGEREEIPAGTPELFQQAIESGWKPNTKDRPTAEQVVSSLKFLLQNLPKPTQVSISTNPSPNPNPNPHLQPMSGLQGNYVSGVMNQSIQLAPKQPPIPHSFQGNLASKMPNAPARPEQQNPQPHPAASLSGIAYNLQTVPTPTPKLSTEEIKVEQPQAENESLKNSMDALLKMKNREEEKKKRHEERKKQKKQERREKRHAETEQLKNLSSNERVNAKAASLAGKVTSAVVTELLTHTMRGDMENVEECLHNNPELAHAQGDITDLSGRTFKNITAFQYAVWALDKEMWQLLLTVLPLTDAYDQLHALEYERQDIIKVHGVHFSFDPLLNAYQSYLANWKGNWVNSNTGAMADIWCNEVGGAQRMMPAWFIFLFTEEDADKAWPSGDLTKRVYRLEKDGEWYGEWHKGDPGANFAYIRGSHKTIWQIIEPTNFYRGGAISYIRIDEANLAKLKSIRAHDLAELTGQLTSLRVKITPATVTEFLTHTIRADLDNVKKCLQNNPALAHAQGDITDLSGRTFKNITAFQYAVWALDKEIWQLLLTVLPLADAYDQLHVLKHERQDIIKVHGVHFSFDLLLNAYQKYLANYDKWYNAGNMDAMTNSWCNDIGGAQRMMPAWFVYLFSEEGADKAWPTGEVEKTVSRIGDGVWDEEVLAQVRGARTHAPDTYAQCLNPLRIKHDAVVLAKLKSARVRELAELTDQLSQAANKEPNPTPLRLGK